MAREGRVRKVNPRDWPGFLRRVIPGAVWQTFLGQVAAGGDPRIRWTPKYVLLCWLAMGWSVQRHLNDRFREGRQLLAALFARRRQPGGSYWGLVKATQRLGADGFACSWACWRQQVPQRLGPLWAWGGWTVMAVDGSRVEAPRTRGHERGLGRAGRAKTGPQWWVTWLTNLPSGLIWDWRQGPGTRSEREPLRPMLAALPPNPLLVADAGFGGFDLWWDLLHSGVDFLIRCVSNTTLLSETSELWLERHGQHPLVYLWPQKRRCRLPLRLRLIVLKRSGQRVYLLTHVLESQRL